MRLLRFLLLVPALLTTGCASFGYYAQAVGGQLDILARERPIAELLDPPPPSEAELPRRDEPLSPALKARLARILAMRDFATHALGLPDNGSYTRYAALDRRYVAWNVIATPEFSLAPKEWCFPVAGCVPYRGYFARGRAERFAAELRAEGLDVRVAPVAGYSTLGWFADPLLSTQLHQSDADLAAVMFHELAHAVVYVPGDAAFNESFATTVELEGVRRWLAQNGDGTAYAEFLRERAYQREFVTLVLEYRVRLGSLYASALPPAEMRARKAQVFAELRTAHAGLRTRWNGYDGYDAWFAQDLNNAHLALVGLYHEYVPAFQALLREVHGDLPAFYRLVRRLARLPPAERAARLSALDTARAGP